MKKVLFILGLVLVSVSFQSCTDESEQAQENGGFEKQLIDKDDIEEPDDR